MTRMSPLVFAALIAMSPWMSRSQAVDGAPSPDRSAAAGDISALQYAVRDLGASDPAVRDRAEAKLVEWGSEVLNALRRHLEHARDPEVAMRLERAIRTIRVRALPAGKVVNGVRYALTVSQPGDEDDRTPPVLSLERPVTVTTHIINTTDEDLTVRVGYSTGGIYFKSGSALRLVRERDGETIVSKPKAQVGWCGTGAYPINAIVPAGRFVAYQTKLQLIKNKSGDDESFFIRSGLYQFRVRGEQRVKVRAALSVSEAAAESSEEWSGAAVVSNGNFWHGEIQSNGVEIRVDPDGGPDAAEQE